MRDCWAILRAIAGLLGTTPPYWGAQSLLGTLDHGLGLGLTMGGLVEGAQRGSAKTGGVLPMIEALHAFMYQTP